MAWEQERERLMNDASQELRKAAGLILEAEKSASESADSVEAIHQQKLASIYTHLKYVDLVNAFMGN